MRGSSCYDWIDRCGHPFYPCEIISINAFGHRTGVKRHDVISRVKNHADVVSHETIF
jgi:hypothetical protein